MRRFLARLAEPSSWGGISVLLALVGVNMPADKFQAVAQLGAAAAAAAAVMLPEKSKP